MLGSDSFHIKFFFDQLIFDVFRFSSQISPKEAIAFWGDLMGNLQYTLPKMQWLLYVKFLSLFTITYYVVVAPFILISNIYNKRQESQHFSLQEEKMHDKTF